jgi:uncharacterized protein YbbC (DUF1343 family)
MRQLATAWTFLLAAAAFACEARATPNASSQVPVAARVTLGVEVLLAERMDLVAGRKVGLVTHAAAVDGALVSTVDRLLGAGVDLVQLWAPEHGLEGALRNSESGQTGRHGASGVAVEAMAAGGTRPSEASVARVDVVLVDLQDIGSRTYTYATTLGRVLEVCARVGRPVVVLDRPNPLGGLSFEGPVRKPRWQSLIGWGPLPVTHGLTLGELARLYVHELRLAVDLTVVPMKGWRRSLHWDDTGLLWVPPSPGIPHPLNAYLYVATGMVGGSGPNVNEGGGNSMPFELIGAPFIDPRRLAAHLEAERLPGVRFRPMTFRPWRGQFGGQVVHGVQLYVTDLAVYRPLRTALAILAALHAVHPDELKVGDETRFHRTWGDERVLPALRAGQGWRELEALWADELTDFSQARQRAILYPP